MKHLNSSERDTAFNSNITEDEWLSFCKDLWTNETENEVNPELNKISTFDPIELEELEGMFKLFKNKKYPAN
jgi:hypothetical protein